MRTQHNLLLEKVPLKNKNQIGAAIEDLETSRRHVSEEIYLRVNQNKLMFHIEK
jgi:hypothetical protein